MFNCSKCSQDTTKLSWLGDKAGWCPKCFYEPTYDNHSAMINTDSIPGGVDIHNGICNPDGTPRKYYSKSDIKKAAYEAGWAISGDTPKLNPRLQEQRAIEREQRAR